MGEKKKNNNNHKGGEKKNENDKKKQGDGENNEFMLDIDLHCEAPVTTVVLKLNLNCKCEGCVKKIRKIVHNTKCVHHKSLDTQKDLLTVKGTMDVETLVKTLNMKLKRSVEVVQPNEEKDGGDGSVQEGGSGGAKNVKQNKIVQPIYGYGLSIKPGMSTTQSICMHPSDMNLNSCSNICN